MVIYRLNRPTFIIPTHITASYSYHIISYVLDHVLVMITSDWSELFLSKNVFVVFFIENQQTFFYWIEDMYRVSMRRNETYIVVVVLHGGKPSSNRLSPIPIRRRNETSMMRCVETWIFRNSRQTELWMIYSFCYHFFSKKMNTRPNHWSTDL